MPELHQLELLEAMLPSSQRPSEQTLRLHGEDMQKEMALCPICQHTKPQKLHSAKHAKRPAILKGPARDIAAFGRIIVQLYRGKMLYHAAADLK